MSFTDGDVVRLLLQVMGVGATFAGTLFAVGIKIVLANEQAKHAALLKRFDKQDEQNSKMWSAFESELRYLDRRMSRVEGSLRLPEIQRRADDVGVV